MKISIECPMCHKVLEGESEWCGQKAQCPYCQQDFDIPEFTPKDDTTTAVEPPPPPKKHPTKWLYATVVTFFILCAVLAIFSVVLAYVIPPKSTHPRAKGEQSANAEVVQKKQEVINDQKNSPSPSSAKESAKKNNNTPDNKSSTKTETISTIKNTPIKSTPHPPRMRTSVKKTSKKPGNKTSYSQKPKSLVEIPKQRDYLGDMDFEKLIITLSDFRNDCRCGDCHKKFSSFFKEKWEADNSLSTLQHIVCIPKCVNVPNLSYGQKKQILLKRYKDVIAYLNELHNAPITQLNDKYMGGKHVKYKEYGGVVRNFSPVPKFPVPTCWWHTKFLAERGCTKAQLAMGFNDGYIDIDSLKWAKKAAGREAKACFLLGHWCCEKSIHFDMYRGPVIKDAELMKVAIDWLKRGSSMCNLDCTYELGKIAMEYLHNGTLALQWFEPAAKMKHGDSIHMCAIIYSKAYGSSLENEVACQNVKPNYRRAIMYYEQLIGMYRNDRNVKGIISECKNLVRNLKSRLED